MALQFQCFGFRLKRFQLAVYSLHDELVRALLLYYLVNNAAQLSAPQNISIQSFNMRHVLRWSPLQATCSSLTYSVKYQGEYEIHVLNSSWVDALHCQEIVQTECDLTHDLASDSDYHISVQARCGERTSWEQLPKTFNRKDTVLLAPDLSVKLKETRIEVEFRELCPDVAAKLKRWWDGEEKNATSEEVAVPSYSFEVQPYGRRYCLRAEVTLESINKSNSTETLCVFVPKPEPVWIKYFAVGICVVLIAVAALTLGIMAPRFTPYLQKMVCHKEPLPSALVRKSFIHYLFAYRTHIS
ncbi:cytokine receptor family member B16 [Trichomycterus rosablanca]|uniref:cytokine receptor family member B16 n=1 Tax=Trichomycterus rosablanca TaxID=2290929 RepID=UPI002F360628